MESIDRSRFTALLNQIKPGSRSQTIELLTSSTSQFFRMVGLDAGGLQVAYFIKLYLDEHDHVFARDAITRAKLEYNVYALLRHSQLGKCCAW